jgi:hypothetical protein
VLAKSNADQVKEIIRIATELGVAPASPQEARQILGFKGLDQVAYWPPWSRTFQLVTLIAY